MSVYVANTKLYVTSTGAIGISGSPLAFNTGDIVPDATVTRDGLVAAGLVTSVAGTSPVSVYPVTLVQDPAGALSDGVVPEWDTTTSKWIPGTALSSTAANATYAPLDATETVVRVAAPSGGDDTAVIAAAIATAQASGKDLVFQAGTYLTDKITFTGLITTTIEWRGAGKNQTTIKKRTSDGNVLLQINATSPSGFLAGCAFTDLEFEGIAGNTPAAVYASDIARCHFRDCRFSNAIIGLQLRGGVGNEFRDCEFSDNGTGISIDQYTSFAGYPNLNRFDSCEILDNTTYGVYFDGGRQLVLSDCDIESNGTNGNAATGGVYVGANVGAENATLPIGVVLNGCWLEANAGGAVVTFSSGRNKLVDCYMVANGNATNDVKITGGRYIIRDCDIDTAKTTSINETTSSSPNFIVGSDIAGGVTTDTAKTTVDNSLPGWTTYSPGISGTGWALGNSTVTAKYRQDGKTVEFRIEITWGSTATYGSVSPNLDLPVQAVSAMPGQFYAEVNDVGNNTYMLYPRPTSAFAVKINSLGASGAAQPLTSTSPVTFSTSDTLILSGTYEAA